MGLTDCVFCTRQFHLQPIIFYNNVMQLGCILFDTDTPDEMFLYAETCGNYNYIVCVSKKVDAQNYLHLLCTDLHQ